MSKLVNSRVKGCGEEGSQEPCTAARWPEPRPGSGGGAQMPGANGAGS